MRGDYSRAQDFFQPTALTETPPRPSAVAILEKIRRMTTASLYPFPSGWHCFADTPPLDKVVGPS